MPYPLNGKDRLIVNTWFTQILLIINISQLPFTLSKLSTKCHLNVAQMFIFLIPSNSILLSDTTLIMATNSPSEKFGRRFGFVVSATGAIAVSSYEWNTTNNDLLKFVTRFLIGCSML